MKLLEFRLQNYKRIDDSGWISVSNLTAFVGKNEAGKSSVFRGLSKLNPSDRRQFNELKELPRSKLNKLEKKGVDAISAKFELEPYEKDEISKLIGKDF